MSNGCHVVCNSIKIIDMIYLSVGKAQSLEELYEESVQHGYTAYHSLTAAVRHNWQ